MKLILQRLLFITILTVCFSVPESSYAQEPLTRKLSLLEGLSSEVVYDLHVDTRGLLYLGTDKGLITYNGVHFEKFPIPESLGNSISNIQQDEKGMIWCKNFANQLFFLQEDTLFVDNNVKALLDKTSENLIDYYIGKKSKYILTQNELYEYTSAKIKSIYSLKEAGSEVFTSIIYDKSSEKTYVASNKHLFTFRNNILIDKQIISSEQKVLELFKGELVYCTKALEQNVIVGKKTISLTKTDLHDTFLNRMSATKDNLWLCTNTGIYEFDEATNSFKRGFLKDSRITDIVQDLEGNHWISTLDEGIYMMPNRKMYQLEVSGIKKRSYTRIAKGPNGNYFVGTNNGEVVEFSDKGKSIREYETNWDNTIEFINFIGDTILTNYGFFKIGNPKIISNKVYFGKYLAEDFRGNLLIAGSSFGGLLPKNIEGSLNYRNKDNKFKVITYGLKKAEAIVFRNKRTKSVAFNGVQQEYYFGFIDGLFVYDLEGNETEIKSKKNEAIIAADMIVNADGSVWIATSQRGVFLLKDKKIILHLSEDNGLSNNNCKRIVTDKQGIWIITETGFNYYNTSTHRIRNAELNLCLKGITVNDIAVLKDIIALATNRGIFYFDKKILDQVIIPQFKFTEFLVNGKKFKMDTNLVLDHNQNNINIKFNTIHYKSLGNYNYRYRLKGLEDKWYTSSSSAKNINFLALTPGVYKFQINVKIGERYTSIQEISFEITKPFWLQIWFLTISILALIALLYFVYRWTELKTRKSEKLKEQLALSQLTALRSQMNPHFIFNVLNAVQGLIYSNQKSKASDYLGNFSDLMRKILDSSDKNEVTIEKEFETIDLYISLEKARFDNDFEYEISFPEDADLSDYSIPSMIIQPFVENAIKHGLMHKVGFKKLEIKVELLEDVWCFTIDDNGIGRKASEVINQKIKKHISFATKAIDNRIKLINEIADIAIDIEIIDKKSFSDESLGTRIKIYIPTSKK